MQFHTHAKNCFVTNLSSWISYWHCSSKPIIIVIVFDGQNKLLPIVLWTIVFFIETCHKEKKHSTPKNNKNKATSSKESSNEQQQQQLTKTWLSTVVVNDDDDSTSTGSRSTSSKSKEEDQNQKQTHHKYHKCHEHLKQWSRTTTAAMQSSPKIITKMKETVKMCPPQTDLEVPTNWSMIVGYPEGKETVVVMTCAYSMFMNCIPLTHKQLGADVLEKNWSVVCNSLFKLAKCYLLPSHANTVVGLCLYDCDYCLAGV